MAREAPEPAVERSRLRPGWTTIEWRQPLGPLFLAGLLLSLGRGAWLTCWAMFFVRSVGLTPAQFGVGVTAAGVIGSLVGGPLGYLADRLGAREVLVDLGLCQGAAILCTRSSATSG